MQCKMKGVMADLQPKLGHMKQLLRIEKLDRRDDQDLDEAEIEDLKELLEKEQMDPMREQDLHAVELERLRNEVDGPMNTEDHEELYDRSECSEGSCFEKTVSEINSQIAAQ